MDSFGVTWEADDGYCGGSRPHHFDIDARDINGDEDEKELRSLFWESVQHDFEQRVSPVSDQEEEFVQWAKEVQEQMRQEEKENAD